MNANKLLEKMEQEARIDDIEYMEEFMED